MSFLNWVEYASATSLTNLLPQMLSWFQASDFPPAISSGILEIQCSAKNECTICRVELGNKRSWKKPGTPAVKYFHECGRVLKSVLKSFSGWSLKNTWNSTVVGFLWPACKSFSFIVSMIFCIAMKVLSPVEQPKSATQKVLEVSIFRSFKSSLSTMASFISSFARSKTRLCRC